MVIPIGDENPTERFPLVNYAIIAANVVAFVALAFRADYGRVVQSYGLVPASPSLVSGVTSMFLHGGLWHLLGNMLYLWIFGDNVEDRLGHFLYPVFYVGGGGCAALLHMIFAWGSEIPMVGASGAVSAALGFYAIYFPRRRVKLFYWVFLFFYGSFTLAAGWAIGLWFVTQFVFGLSSEAGEAGVAYWAHVGGFGFGVLVGILCRSLSCRRADRAAEAVGAVGAVGAEPVPLRSSGPAPRRAPAGRHETLEAFARSDSRRFLRSYLDAARTHGEKRIAAHHVLHAAELLRASGRYLDAARAYERFVRSHPEDPEVARAMYALGTIYTRKLNDPRKALVWFRRADALSRARAPGADRRRPFRPRRFKSGCPGFPLGTTWATAATSSSSTITMVVLGGGVRRRQEQPVLRYSDRKFFLLGRRIATRMAE